MCHSMSLEERTGVDTKMASAGDGVDYWRCWVA